MQALPSALALADLHRRWRSVAQHMVLGEAELVLLLRLDPLASLRALRAAHTPAFRTGHDLTSIQAAVQCLGVPVTRQLLEDTPPVHTPSTELRTLWRHSIATALAAEDLAQKGGLMHPPAAYLLGLLHDLPLWLQWIQATLQPQEPTRTAAHWLAHWQLPTSLQAALLVTFRTDSSQEPPHDAGSLVRTAERLASLAGFPHPAADEQAAIAALAAADKSDLATAQQLRRRVEGALRTFGFDQAIPEAELDRSPPPTILTGQREGGLDELVLRVLGGGRPERHLGIVTALTAAAVRFCGYDRAFHGRWNPATGRLHLRTKCEAAARRLTLKTLQPTPGELAALRTAQQTGDPVLLQAPFGPPAGLLGVLSTDELLAVPMNRELAQPAFLLLDRSVQLTPIELGTDQAKAQTLGIMGSMLHESLLLRRRQQRAQKFAVTDPLTRLSNRRMGLAALEREVARAERSGRQLTVLMCDLDHFKQLNDAYGHLQGDVALQAAADVLRQTVRRGDVVCRYGGEEFLVVLAETSPDEAAVLAARLFTAIAAHGEQLGLPLTVSIGLTSYRAGDTAAALLQRADGALYASKGHGRNRFSADVDATDLPPVPLP